VRVLIGGVLALALVASAGAACGKEGTSSSSPGASGPAASSPAATSPSVSQAGAEISTVDLVRQLRGSVVHIASEFASIDIFGQIEPQQGVGTGFIADEDGHIVTNNHVVTGETARSARDIKVTLDDGREFQAQIVGRDPPSDLAVLKIDAQNLHSAKLGKSADLQVGEEVVAIGNALNLPGGPTVTKGVVSALNRVIQEEGVSIPDAIQTDAAINPGNSGGPLVNMRGEVVGITTAVIRAQFAEGIGLAISIDSARPIIEELIAKGEIDRGFLGVTISPPTQVLIDRCGLSVEDGARGVILTSVQDGSPAASAGLQQCDLLTKLAGAEMNNTGDLFRALTEHRAGETVQVEYERDGQKQTADVTLG
jgi:serine protease Do